MSTVVHEMSIEQVATVLDQAVFWVLVLSAVTIFALLVIEFWENISKTKDRLERNYERRKNGRNP